MTSDLVPIHPAQRSAKVKDAVIALLALCLCFCLVALIHETGLRQESAKLQAGQVQEIESLQKSNQQILAEKAESQQALRRAKIDMKAGAEAQSIALSLRQSTATARSR